MLNIKEARVEENVYLEMEKSGFKCALENVHGAVEELRQMTDPNSAYYHKVYILPNSTALHLGAIGLKWLAYKGADVSDLVIDIQKMVKEIFQVVQKSSKDDYVLSEDKLQAYDVCDELSEACRYSRRPCDKPMDAYNYYIGSWKSLIEF